MDVMDVGVEVLEAAALSAAHELVRAHVHRTPVFTSTTLDRAVGASVFLKAESLQKVGAFKMRGAANAVLSLAEGAAARGVVTHSSGNHGQAVAAAAGLRGVTATVVVPRGAPAAKVAAIRGYGATIVECAPTLAAREETAARVVAETGGVLVHPYDDERVIAGQATAAKELVEDVPGLDVVLAPIGGGGLLAGTACALAAFAPGTRAWGVEPAGADDAARSLAAGRIVAVDRPVTVADGLRATIGERPFVILRRLGVGVVTVEDDEIVAAMRFVWERLKLVIEPSAAVPVAALLTGRLAAEVAGRRVGVILTGGNVDLDQLPF